MHYPILRQTVYPRIIKKINQVNGLENIPHPPYIIAANHQGFLDPLIVASVILKNFNRKTYFLTQSTMWRIWGRYLAVHWLGMIPIDRNNKSQSIEMAEEYIKKGGIVGIFPEGTRYPEKGLLLKGKTGAIRLALATKVPLCPCGVINPTGHRLGKAFMSLCNSKKEISINIGKPLKFDKYYNQEITKELLEQATREIMQEVGKLCGKIYPY